MERWKNRSFAVLAWALGTALLGACSESPGDARMAEGEHSGGTSAASGGAPSIRGGPTNVGGLPGSGGTSPLPSGGSPQQASGGGSPNAGTGGSGLGGSGVGGESTGGAGGNSEPATNPDPSSYTCSMIIGILATEEWYREGFEELVNNDRWQLKFVHGGMVEMWADPNDQEVWGAPVQSPCAANATNPDRVIFVSLNWEYNTVQQWKPPLAASVVNIKAKFPNVRRIELATFVRAPGNMTCPGVEDPGRLTITAAQDQAIAELAAEQPDLVVAAPKFEANSCSEFSDLPPHPTEEGGAAWAQMMAAYYGP